MNNEPAITATAPPPREVPTPAAAARASWSPRWIDVALCFLAAVLLRWWVAPMFAVLPANYAADTSYAATLRSRERPSSPVEETATIVRRHDQTLTARAGRSIIQGEAHWMRQDGSVIFETLNAYGVDRRTRENLASFGNAARRGQYLFPPHTEKRSCILWDPTYAGPSTITFARTEVFHGIEVHVFDTSVEALDETEGYAALTDVPEKYHALTDGKGRLWVEPVSGVVVDHEDRGVSWFVEPKTGAHVGEPLNQWEARYTPETVAAQLQRATATRRRMLLLENWIPLVLSAAGLVFAALALRRRRGGTS